MKIFNFRKCILENKIKPKSELIRIVKTKDGHFLVNSNAKGRGAYISQKVDNPELIIKKRVLNKSFRMNVPLKIYHSLLEVLKK